MPVSHVAFCYCRVQLYLLPAVPYTLHPGPSYALYPTPWTTIPELQRRFPQVQKTELEELSAYKKRPPPRTLQHDFTWGHMVVLGGGGCFLCARYLNSEGDFRR